MQSFVNTGDETVVAEEVKVLESSEQSEETVLEQSESFVNVVEEKAEENSNSDEAEENVELIAENVAYDSEQSVEHADKPQKSSESFAAMITTVDNPFDPFEQFDDWFRYDEEKGFHTCSYLGRVAQTSDEMSDEEFRKAVEKAIDQIIKYDFMNIYKKVKRPVQDEPVPQQRATVQFD